MSKPLAICIENLNARSHSSRYLRCVALPGRQAGLRLDRKGKVQWMQEDMVACELWVSADDRLILYREEGMEPIQVQRAGRSLDVPFSKPVVLLNQDQITIGDQTLRVHIHGEARVVSPPSYFPINPGAVSRLTKAAGTAAIVGALIATGSCTEPTIEIRDFPPIVVTQETTPVTPSPTIEVRDFPPEIVITKEVTQVTPSPTIEVRDFPPTATAPVFSDQLLISAAVQGEWFVAQVFEVQGERAWYTSTLVIEDNSYLFKPAVDIAGSPVEDTLSFLFTNPTGVISLQYANGVTPEDTLDLFAPGDVLATFVFRAGGEAASEFDLQMKDTQSLFLIKPASQDSLWHITRHIENISK